MTPFEKYCSDCKRLGFKPTMSEEQINEAYGIKPVIAEQNEFIARKSGSEKCVAPTFSNYEKRVSRKGWSAEKIAARKAENVRRYREKKKEADSRGVILS